MTFFVPGFTSSQFVLFSSFFVAILASFSNRLHSINRIRALMIQISFYDTKLSTTVSSSGLFFNFVTTTTNNVCLTLFYHFFGGGVLRRRHTIDRDLNDEQVSAYKKKMSTGSLRIKKNERV